MRRKFPIVTTATPSRPAAREGWSPPGDPADVAEAGGNAPLSLRLATRARAEYALRQQAQSGSKSLADALRVMESSSLVHEALGEHIFEWFLRNKRSEWRGYKTQVTPFELQRYLKSI